MRHATTSPQVNGWIGRDPEAVYGAAMEQPQFWFRNTRTGQVETDDHQGPGPGPPGALRLPGGGRPGTRPGPAERTEAWDEEDRRWREGTGAGTDDA